MRRFISRKDTNEKSPQTPKTIDPMSYTERTIFFQKNAREGESIDNLDALESKEPTPQNPDQGTILELQKPPEEEKPQKLTEVRSPEVRKLVDDSLIAVKEFSDKKMKLLYKQLEEEKHLTKELNDTLNVNLDKITKLEEELEIKKLMLEGELNKKTRRLLESERHAAIGDLASRLAHDIKNPLTVINNTIQVLKQRKGGVIDEYVIKRFEMLEESAFRINHQIDGVLDYIKETPLKIGVASLSQILKSALLPLKVPQNISLSVPSKELSLRCDAIKMEVLFGNLILNSIQAIGNDPGQIFVRYKEEPDRIIFEVADSGKGIPPENLNKIFNPLFTTKQEGTGLGLTSCKTIVEQHGGKIEVKNNPTTFTFTLPKIGTTKP
jgi:signal transduction histidine kinase